MSCYEGEQGTIVIPSAKWAKFKQAVRNAWNTWQDENYKVAMQVWELISESASDLSVPEQFEDITDKLHDTRLRSRNFVDAIDWNTICSNMLGRDRRNFYKPRKSWFSKVTNRTRRMSYCEWSIEFNNDRREVRWYVDWNNHAIATARAHPVPCKMFYMLNHMIWTGQSGGTITSDDEYNRDNYGAPSKEYYGTSPESMYMVYR